MTPNILTTFIINTLKAKIQDVFTYDSFAWGNITARFGSTIFYQNTDFDNADIVIVPDTAYVDYKEIDLPLDSAGRIKQGTYEITYNVKQEEWVLSSAGDISTTVPGSATMTTITMSPGLSIGEVNTIGNILAEYGTVEMVFFNSSNEAMLLVEGVSSVTSSTVTFPEITFNDYEDISYIRFYVPAFYEKSFIYEFCDETPVSNLCVTHNCFTSQLSVLDDTIYPADITVVSRELTIQYPRLQNGTPVQPAVEIESASYTIGPNIYTGNYTVTNVVNISFTGTDGLIQTNEITTYIEHEVSCDAGLCELFNCINSLRSAYETAVRSGSHRTQELEQINFQVVLYVQAYKLAAECENTAQAESILSSLKEYLGANATTVSANCNCGCGDNASENGVPTIIYPLYGGSGGSGGAGTVTNFSFTLGSTGNDVNAAVVNPTTTPALTLNLPTASATKRGLLSTTDWSTFNNKAPVANPTFTGTVTTPAIIVSSETASRVAIIDASKNVKSADTTTYPSLTELAYVKGVTSAIQTQLGNKQAALGFTPENVANKSTDGTFSANSNTLYPSQSAAKTYADTKQTKTEVDAVTATYSESATAYTTKILYAEDSGGGYTITLNNNLTVREVYIYKTNKSSNTIQVAVTGCTINGKSTVNLCNQYECVRVVFDGLGGTEISAVKTIPIQKQTFTANGSINVPRGYYIASIVLQETIGNAVTGGLNIATAPAGNDVVAAKAVGASQTTYVTDAEMLKRIFSISAAQTIYVEAVTAWNLASVNLWIEFKEMN